MKKIFSTFALALILAFSTITAFANAGAATPRDEVVTSVLTGSINLNGDVFELEKQLPHVHMLFTFDNFAATLNEYPIEVDVLFKTTDPTAAYDEADLEVYPSYVSWNGEAWEIIVYYDYHIILTLDDLMLAFESEYPVELTLLLHDTDGMFVLQVAPVSEEQETAQSVAPLMPVPPTSAFVPQPTPAPNIAPPPATGIDLSRNVWLPATGTRYHSVNNCGNMNPARARSMTRQEARNAGHQACARCW